MRHMVHDERDILLTGEKREGSKTMEEKVYKVMKGAGATNIVLGVVSLTVGIVAGVLMIVTGARLIAGKSKILF